MTAAIDFTIQVPKDPTVVDGNGRVVPAWLHFFGQLPKLAEALADPNVIPPGETYASQAEQETATATDRVVSPGRQQYHPSAAKFWAKASGGGSPAIVASHNVTSISRPAAGRLTITLTTPFSSANWACVAMVEGVNTTAFLGAQVRQGTQTAADVQIECRTGASTLTDPDAWFVIGYGDQ